MNSTAISEPLSSFVCHPRLESHNDCLGITGYVHLDGNSCRTISDNPEGGKHCTVCRGFGVPRQQEPDLCRAAVALDHEQKAFPPCAYAVMAFEV